MGKNLMIFYIFSFFIIIVISEKNEKIKTEIANIKKNISIAEIFNTNITNNLIDDGDIDISKIDYVEHIIIQNTHEDQLIESIFYFLSFVLIIYIILFLYKFYKCYCENTIKEFGEENGMRNPNNDPELQRISTTDDENIIFDKKEKEKDEDDE
jgi:hypothetical protein